MDSNEVKHYKILNCNLIFLDSSVLNNFNNPTLVLFAYINWYSDIDFILKFIWNQLDAADPFLKETHVSYYTCFNRNDAFKFNKEDSVEEYRKRAFRLINSSKKINWYEIDNKITSEINKETLTRTLVWESNEVVWLTLKFYKAELDRYNNTVDTLLDNLKYYNLAAIDASWFK